MSGLEDAATRRAQHGNMMQTMRRRGRQLMQYVEETIRDPLLALRSEVEANADGEYQDGDLESIDAMNQEIKRRLTQLANSFTP